MASADQTTESRLSEEHQWTFSVAHNGNLRKTELMLSWVSLTWCWCPLCCPGLGECSYFRFIIGRTDCSAPKLQQSSDSGSRYKMTAYRGVRDDLSPHRVPKHTLGQFGACFLSPHKLHCGHCNPGPKETAAFLYSQLQQERRDTARVPAQRPAQQEQCLCRAALDDAASISGFH